MKIQTIKCPSPDLYDVEMHEVIDTDESVYQFLRSAVEGMIECIHLPRIGADMWCNGEYLYTLDPGRVNRIAMDIATYSGCMQFFEHPIFGNVAITGGADEEGRSLGLDLSQIDTINEVLVEAITKTEETSFK